MCNCTAKGNIMMCKNTINSSLRQASTFCSAYAEWMFEKQQNQGRSIQWAADSYTFQDQSQLMHNIISSSYLLKYLLIKRTEKNWFLHYRSV